MGCPCANPPGQGKHPVPRHPTTLKPLSESGRLSRRDIRSGRVLRVPMLNPQSPPKHKGGANTMSGFISAQVNKK